MAIFRRTVSKYGKSGGYLTLPASFISKEVIIIADDDLQQFSDAIHTAYLLNKVGNSEITVLNQKFEDLKNNINPRIAFFERTLTALIKPQLVQKLEPQNLNKSNNEIPKELPIANTPNNTTTPDN